MMGAGKTTTGRMVAAQLACPFVDLDEMLERASNMSVTNIFATYGQRGFREMERRALLEVLADSSERVLAVGGGTPVQPGLMDALLGASRVFWLRCSAKILARRVMRDGLDKRPLVAACVTDEEVEAALSARLAERCAVYARAHDVVDVGERDSALAIAMRIVSRL